MNTIDTEVRMTAAKAECERLVNAVVGAAKGMRFMQLTDILPIPFFPFAVGLDADGTLVLVGGYDGRRKAPPREKRIGRLKDELRAEAAAHKIIVSALVDCVVGTDPATGATVDGILVCVDHRDGISVERWFVDEPQRAVDTPFSDWLRSTTALKEVSCHALPHATEPVHAATERPGAADIFVH